MSRLIKIWGGETTYKPVAANAVIEAGDKLCGNANGYLVPAANVSAYNFAGIAGNSVDNTGGANGALSVIVIRKCRFEDDCDASITQANCWGNAYVLDALTSCAVGDVKIGQIVNVDLVNMKIEIDSAVMA